MAKCSETPMLTSYMRVTVISRGMNDLCGVLVQVRYIEWFYTNSIARVECENLYMVPLSRAVYEVVVEQVLKRVQCKGRNVYKMVQAEKHEEQVSLQTWRTPVYVAVPVIGESGYVAATWLFVSA